MLTTEKILDTAEDVLRRFGPRKATVVDVARALDVSHGTVYRHFASKAELHAAITKRWLQRVTLPLIAIAESKTKPKKRLRQWFDKLVEIKQQKAKEDPEMFASYSSLAEKLPKEVISKHLEILINQVQGILVDGNKDGSFVVDDCAITARSLFFATVRYHHPIHVHEWDDENIAKDFEHLFSLLELALTNGN